VIQVGRNDVTGLLSLQKALLLECTIVPAEIDCNERILVADGD
jgi:hypothetical protein